jgi:hypothetical protein
MSCAEDIALFVDGLYLAGLSKENLSYELDEKLWPGFLQEIKAMGGAVRPDAVAVTFMGMTVRKR